MKRWWRSTRFYKWWIARVRGFGPGMHQPGPLWYVRITPNLGFAFRRGPNTRIRWARHHGLQRTRWYQNGDGTAGRWFVDRQLFGKSRVRGERYTR